MAANVLFWSLFTAGWCLLTMLPEASAETSMFKRDFFFLRCGRSRSKAWSLHENKQLSRKLQHGHRWSHANWQIMTTKHKTPQPKGKMQIPARFASHQDSEANSKRGKSPTKTTTEDLPRTQWWKPTMSQTQKHAANELIATQWSETRDRRCCQESNNGSHLLYTLA